MNKFEKLIEYIINDEDQKARELFHTIVVEKSRDIYESIMDEESMEETVAGNQVEDMVDEISTEEAVGEDNEEGAEFELGGDDSEEEMGDEMAGDEMASDEAEEDKIMNIDAKLDELLAKFDEIMGDSGDEMPAEEPAMDMADEMGAEEQPEEGMYEAKEGSGNPFAKGSGKSGSAQSGKSGSAKSGVSGKSGSGKMEGRKSATELMREYVETVGDIYGGAGDAAEGDAVGGAGKKTSVNAKSITGPGADFGGHTASSKGGEQNQDGTSAPSTDKAQEIKSGNINVPGGKAGNAFKTKESAKDAEGSTTDGSVPVSDKSVVRK
jgi:hypothetical protein